jgi:hypothetical protein
MKEFLEHLSKFNNISDEEIEELASNENGIDAEEALLLHLERDFVQSFNKEVIKGLKNL